MVVETVKSFECDVQINEGKEHTVIAVLGSGTGQMDTQVFEVLPSVEQVLRIQKPFKLASRDFKSSDTTVNIGDIQVGPKTLTIMAGPCSVESEKQIVQCAIAAKHGGARILRGGAFKPRTSPFAFQGLKLEGLKMLAKARQETGLLVVTEVVSPEGIDVVAEYVDILQIGARNMQNYILLDAVGKSKKPVLLKRGFSATVEEWLMAADYILRYNERPNVMLCLRGIRTFDTSTRFTCDFGILPVLRGLTHLPIIADPSHVAGNFRYVTPITHMAVAAGADGLIIEIHPDPKKAMSDGAQSLTFSDFSRLTESVRSLGTFFGRKM